MIVRRLAKKIFVRVISPIILMGLVLLTKIYKYKIFMMHTDRLGHLNLNTQLFFIRHNFSWVMIYAFLYLGYLPNDTLW